MLRMDEGEVGGGAGRFFTFLLVQAVPGMAGVRTFKFP